MLTVILNKLPAGFSKLHHNLKLVESLLKPASSLLKAYLALKYKVIIGVD